MKNPAAFELPEAHKYFAVTMNNQAWDLVEKADRTSEENEEMLHLAHAALTHWKEIAKPVNLQRAYCLLATAYVSARQPQQALFFSKKTLDASGPEVEGLNDFDRAAAHGCLFNALSLDQQLDQARTHRETMKAIMAKLSDEEKTLLDQLYSKEDQ